MKHIQHTARLALVFTLTTLFIGCSTHNVDTKTAEKPAPQHTPKNIEEIVVTGIRRSLEEPLEVKRQASSIVGAISSEDIKSLPALELNEALQTTRRVHGNGQTRDQDTIEQQIAHIQLNQSAQIFRDYGVNPTISTKAKSDSTFGLDVDTGSYKLALNMLRNGHLPHKEGIRVEEFINAQTYQYQTNNDLFALSAEAMPSPFREGYHILHLGVQAQYVSDKDRLPANLVLVADVSSSMQSDNKLTLLKEAFTTLVAHLRKDDRVAIVSYANTAHVILDPTSAKHKRKIINAINKLKANGGTNAAAGMKLAYKTADNMYQAGLINRVIISSDGMANIGTTSPEGILNKIKTQKERGIFLTTVGVGQGMYNDALLEQLANQGNGHYLYLGNKKDIQTNFVDTLTSQLQTVAKNAKAQIIFNPTVVSHYRLLGYENRALNKEDFLDASKDGGEVGAGHHVTALYEIKLKTNTQPNNIASFSIAYQKPAGERIYTLNKTIPSNIVRKKDQSGSSDLKLSAATAAFAEKLRGTYWSNQYKYSDILTLLSSLPSSYMRKDQIKELQTAINTANRLDTRETTKNTTNEFNLDHVPLLQ